MPSLGKVKSHVNEELVRQSQIVQSVMYSYDAVISSYITPAIHSRCWFCNESARDFDDET